MSPVGRPTEDGEIIKGSRLYSGKVGNLGVLNVWDCPACGKKNESQKVEHGCIHCGAGDQRKGTAGGTKQAAPQAPQKEKVPPPEVSRNMPRRLVEAFLADIRTVCHRHDLYLSPGTGEFLVVREDTTGWLMAADATAVGAPPLLPAPKASEAPMLSGPVSGFRTLPPGYLAFSARVAEQDLKLAHTLALALSSIAEELDANMEPEKFLTRQEALALANALMQQIPDDWNPQPPAEDEAPPQTIGDI